MLTLENNCINVIQAKSTHQFLALTQTKLNFARRCKFTQKKLLLQEISCYKKNIEGGGGGGGGVFFNL